MIEECMELMTHHHIRHLPLLQDDQLLSLILIGDVVREMLAAQKLMIEKLHSFISGSSRRLAKKCHHWPVIA
jgi:CBS domain-containing protein